MYFSVLLSSRTVETYSYWAVYIYKNLEKLAPIKAQDCLWYWCWAGIYIIYNMHIYAYYTMSVSTYTIYKPSCLESFTIYQTLALQAHLQHLHSYIPALCSPLQGTTTAAAAAAAEELLLRARTKSVFELRPPEINFNQIANVSDAISGIYQLTGAAAGAAELRQLLLRLCCCCCCMLL